MDTSFARPWLRFEGLAGLAAAAVFYHHFHLHWMWFFVLLLAPDLSLAGYFAGPKTGAWIYNLAHTYVLALGLVCVGLFTSQRHVLGLGLIWCAHIGMDRAVGYGLKSPAGFRLTHLGLVGRDKTAVAPAGL